MRQLAKKASACRCDAGSRLPTFLLNELHDTPAGLALFVGTPDSKAGNFLGLTGSKGFGQCWRHENVVSGAANKSEILALLALQRAVQLFKQPRQFPDFRKPPIERRPLVLDISDLHDGARQQFRHIGKLAMLEAEAGVSISCRITERLFAIDVVDAPECR